MRGWRKGKREPVEPRFWRHVERTSGCWLWIGGKRRGGYGRIWMNGRSEQAHRVSHQLHVGPVPDGMLVLHRCDNTACVNPAHLFLGTHLDNMADMMSKGRRNAAHGEAHSSAKLTEADVLTIRASNESNVALATRFGVTHSLVSLVRLGRVWKHLTLEAPALAERAAPPKRKAARR